MKPLRWKEYCDHKLPSKFTRPIRINKHEFILVTGCRGISKYNIISKKWVHGYIAYPSKHRIFINPVCAYNHKTNTLYLYNQRKSDIILKINVLTRKVLIIKNKPPKIRNPKLIFIAQKLHLIGGDDNDQHLIFDESEQTFTPLGASKAFNNTEVTNLRLNDKQNKILILDCNDNGLHKFSKSKCSSIYSYSYTYSNCTNSNFQQWTTPIIELPLKMSKFAYTATKNQQYIVLLGGCHRSVETDNIYIINLYQKDPNPIKSQMKCPTISKFFHAITMTTEQKDEMVVCGYIRNVWKTDGILITKLISFLPFYLIQYISRWYSNEYLHLFETNMDPALHWVITIDQLLINL